MNKIGLEQETAVFKALAPKDIAELLDKDTLTFPEHFKLINLFSHFGFTELTDKYRKENTCIIDGKAERIIREGSDADFEKLINDNGWNLDDTYFIEKFNESIHSNGLKKLFS